MPVAETMCSAGSHGNEVLLRRETNGGRDHFFSSAELLIAIAIGVANCGVQRLATVIRRTVIRLPSPTSRVLACERLKAGTRPQVTAER
jgi:hypothetical protein